MKQTIHELAETTASSVTGTSFTAYGLQPVKFLKEIVDAAQKQLFFANFVQVIYAEKGVKDVTIPKRTNYLGRGGMSFDTSEPTNSTVTWTTLDNLDSVTATPALAAAGFAISNHSLQTNAVNLVEAARQELSYAIGDRVDYAVSQAINDATPAANDGSAIGAQTLYGGDATGADSLAAGDVITTDLVAKAKTYLMDTKQHYRDGTGGKTGTEAISTSVTKNPWQPTPGEPFVLFIGPAQQETFLKDSQFVNAAEYGSDMVVQNGEIGTYLGVRIVVTTNVETAAASGTAPDGSTAAVAMTRCVMMKAKRAAALVYGYEPKIHVFEYPSSLQQRLVLETSYQCKVIHHDAIVFIDVSDA